MKKIIRLTESDLSRIVRRILKESNDDPRMYHRYTDGGNPGIEKFFEDPLNDAIAEELESQLENDEYANIDNPTNVGKGTRTMRIILNGRKYTVDDFIDQVQEDGEANTCHTIDEYEYKNRFLGSTIITIKTDEGPCKKKTTPVKDEPKPTPKPTQKQTPKPQKKDVPSVDKHGCPWDEDYYANIMVKGGNTKTGRFDWSKVVPSMGVSKESICKCVCLRYSPRVAEDIMGCGPCS